MFTTPFFPSAYNPVAELAPLFRVLDSAVAELAPTSERAARHQHRRSFTPRFDVREVGSSYELQGELPGIEQKDLDIEFVDDKTLVIRGKTVREHEASNVDQTAAPAVEGAQDNTTATADDASDKSANYHNASVEDEDGFVDAAAETEKSDVAKGKTAETAAAVPDPETSVPEKRASEPEFKYWVSERSVGEFERRFAFPGRVDQEAVKASLRNGILSVVVPKIVEQSARKIEIQ